MRTLLATILFSGLSTIAIGQESRPRINRSYVGDYLASIPDPEKVTTLLPFALNPSVEKEIGLTKESRIEIERLLSESGGSLSSPSVTFDNLHRKGMNLVDFQRSIDTGIVNVALAAKVGEINRASYDICSTLEIDRLRQLVYRIEIERVGLCEALLKGFLGRRIGLENYQRSSLQILGEAIEHDEQVAIKRQLSRFTTDLSSVLSFEQTLLLSKLLGEPFVFRDDPYCFSYCRNIPNPNSLLAMISLVPNISVAKELRLPDGELAEFKELLRKSKGSLEITTINPRSDGKKLSPAEIQQAIKSKTKAHLDLVNNILDPRQKDRLVQLVYHVEIARLGLNDSLTKGYLGKDVGISEEQKDKVAKVAKELEMLISKEVENIRESGRAKLLRELTPVQRSEATKAIGKTFSFREVQ